MKQALGWGEREDFCCGGGDEVGEGEEYSPVARLASERLRGDMIRGYEERNTKRAAWGWF